MTLTLRGHIGAVTLDLTAVSDQQKHSLTDSVRQAVERTFQSTVGSAAVGRERAQELVDEVVRRGEESARTAGELGSRIREAVKDLRLATGEDIKKLQQAVESLQERITAVEKSLSSQSSKETGPSSSE